MNLILLTELSTSVCRQEDVFSHETFHLWTTFSLLEYSIHRLHTKHFLKSVQIYTYFNFKKNYTKPFIHLLPFFLNWDTVIN